MIKILKYNLKRIIVNKMFLLNIFILLFYSRMIMRREIILGIANTAPFSVWSYGVYFSKIIPLLFISLLFIVTLFYSDHEKSVQVIINSTPVNLIKYKSIKFLSVLTSHFILLIMPVLYSMYFYSRYFKYYDYTKFIMPIAFDVVPLMLFVFGIGIFLAERNNKYVYIFMCIVTLMGIVKLPYIIDISGNNYFSSYPAVLNMTEPSFVFEMNFTASRIIMGSIGIILLISVLLKNNN